MNFSDILTSALRYYNIIGDTHYFSEGSIIMKNSNFVDSFIDEVNFTAECYEVDDRLERGWNVNSLGDYVVVSPFKKRKE